MSDVEERIKSLEFRIQNIESQIQNLTADSNTSEKKSNTGQSGAKKCLKCKEPAHKRYIITSDENWFGVDYSGWVDKGPLCITCLENMDVNEADYMAE
jgi:hypothetical protein